LRAFSRSKDDLRKAVAQRSVVIDPREAEILEGPMFQAG